MGQCMGALEERFFSEKNNHSVNRRNRTRFLELPTELLICIAEEIDTVDRRRLSQTSSRLFHIINSHKQFKTRKEIGCIQLISEGGCMKMEFWSSDLKNACRSLCILPDIDCTRPYLDDKNIFWTATVDKAPMYTKSIDYLEESLEYLDPERLIYVGTDASTEMITDMMQLHPHCSFMEATDISGTLTESFLLHTMKCFMNFIENHEEYENEKKGKVKTAEKKREREREERMFEDVECVRSLNIEQMKSGPATYAETQSFVNSTLNLYVDLRKAIVGRKLCGEMSYTSNSCLFRTLTIRYGHNCDQNCDLKLTDDFSFF